jgi:hypothetical protein
MKYLVLDVTNILYRTFFAHKTEDDITVAGLASHTALVTINKYYKAYKPHKIIMCFDRSSWRKEYTKSEQCISGKPYKGNRRQKMTPKEKAKYELFLSHLNDFEEMIRDHTSIVTLAGDGLEADDLVAGTIQTVGIMDDDAEFIIVSGDKDMIQLLKYKNVELIDPATGKQRTLKEWDGDAKLFMFEKCLRGDLGDNVQAAYPRVRKQRILKAYNDPYERANLMMETWTAPDGKQFLVKELFAENMMLMDLESQPEEIQQRIVRTVIGGLNSPGTFSYFHFVRYCGQYELKKVIEQAEQFVPMLSR